MWNFIRTNLIPTALMIVCPLGILFLAKFGQGNPTNMTWSESVFGNTTSWTIASVMISWAVLFLKIPAKQHYGPATYSGYRPPYQENGFLYYVSSCLTLITASYVWPWIPRTVYLNIPHLVATLNTSAVIACGFLYWKGKYYPQEEEKLDKNSVIFEYYRGMEVHPRVFGIDVKQFTNCRFGMMSWLLLAIVYYIYSLEEYGFNWGLAVSVVLQVVYMGKFFWWETGYFNTLDIILDRAGFYICWGCLSLLPAFYAFPIYYLAANPPTIGKWPSLIILVFGLFCIFATYLIDHEKEIFKASKGKRCLWSDKPIYVRTEYDTKNGKRESKLLASGLWGICRHLNYVCEIGVYFSWALPGYNLGLWPFINAIFLTVLLVHRTYRDEDKCSRKYGAAWDSYCNLVKYKIIPYVF